MSRRAKKLENALARARKVFGPIDGTPKKHPTIHVLLADYLAMANKCGDPEQARIYHASIKDDPKIWNGLELQGYQEYNDEIQLELRECARCGSTLAIKVPCALHQKT